MYKGIKKRDPSITNHEIEIKNSYHCDYYSF